MVYGMRFPVLISHPHYTNMSEYEVTSTPTPSTLAHPVPPLPPVLGVREPQRTNHTALPALKIDLNDSEPI